MRFQVERKETYAGSCHEVVKIRASSGYGENHPGWYLIRADSRHIEDGDIRLEEGSGIFRPEFGKELQRRLECSYNQVPYDPRDTPVIDLMLALSSRARKLVRNLRLTTLADLCRISEPELRQVKNVGEKSVDEIKHALRAYGLSLRDPAKARPSRKSSFNKVPSCPSPSQLNRSPV